MGQLVQDLKLALRSLRRDRLFALVAVLTLAIGMGATTAVFSVAYQVLLRPLPYPEPDRLVRVWQALSPNRTSDKPYLNERISVSYQHLLAWRARAHALSQLEALRLGDETLTGVGAPERLQSARVTSGLFPLLGVEYAVGSGWPLEAERPGQDQYVVLSYELWRRLFGRDPSVVGRTVTLGGVPHVVTGVLPEGFAFAPAEVWRPLAPEPTVEFTSWQGASLWVAAQLRPGVSLEQARDELGRISAELAVQHPETKDYSAVHVEGWHAHLAGPAREQLFLLCGVVVLLLLIACTNVANLQLARATARGHEAAIRAALGATERRLFSQFLVESALLSALGAAGGLLMAAWAVGLLRLFVPSGLVAASDSTLDLQPVAVLGTAGLSILTTLSFGVLPALRASRAHAQASLVRGVPGATGPARVRSLLVTAQVALALVPLVGAALMLRTLSAMGEAPLGFDPTNVTVGELLLAGERYSTDGEASRVIAEWVARVEALPGVTDAGAVSALPLAGRNAASPVEVQGMALADSRARGVVGFRAATPGYFAALRIPLAAGRSFGVEDRADGANVVVVNETFARRFFGGERAIGRQVRLAWEDEPFREIVGVVGDVRHKGVDTAPAAELFLPAAQFILPRMTLVVRSERSAFSLAPSLREELRALDPDRPLVGVRPMGDLIRHDTERRRVLGTLLAVLAVIGVVLATVGLYGVVAYAVTQRSRELAIRIALGATPEHVLGLVMRNGLSLAAVGVVIGLAGAVVLARALRGLLYGVAPLDPLTFAAVPLVFLGVALVASWLPSRRVLKLDPHEALRSDG